LILILYYLGCCEIKGFINVNINPKRSIIDIIEDMI
jgi:hypothetical protein